MTEKLMKTKYKYYERIEKDIHKLLNTLYEININKPLTDLSNIHDIIHLYDEIINHPLLEIKINEKITNNFRKANTAYLRRIVELAFYAGYIDYIIYNNEGHFIKLTNLGCDYIKKNHKPESYTGPNIHDEFVDFSLNEIIDYYTNILAKINSNQLPIASTFLLLIDGQEVEIEKLYNNSFLPIDIFDEKDKLIIY